MSAFIDDIARISARDGREHIDYVPAQIVTEYFRRVFRIDDAALDGIIYPSTRSAQGRNIALFVQRDDIQGLSRWGETLRFRPRLSSFFNVTAVDGVVQGWDEVARSSL
ncbi:RES family NAD+ phosphorylase [Sphingobium limneticum]